MKRILISFIFIFPLLISCKNTIQDTYLIPKGFKGKVNIIFNQPNGKDIKLENGKRVYEIPSDGLLITKVKDQYGNIDHQYFYVDATGKREQLPILSDKKTAGADSMKIGIFYDGTTGVYGNSGVANPLYYQEFFVSDYIELDSFFTSNAKSKFETLLKEKIE